MIRAEACQLSRTGFRLDWQCYGRVIMLLDPNHSLCLRMPALSVLIRPLSASLSLTAAFRSKVCKRENNSLPPPVSPTLPFYSLCLIVVQRCRHCLDILDYGYKGLWDIWSNHACSWCLLTCSLEVKSYWKPYRRSKFSLHLPLQLWFKPA